MENMQQIDRVQPKKKRGLVVFGFVIVIVLWFLIFVLHANNHNFGCSFLVACESIQRLLEYMQMILVFFGIYFLAQMIHGQSKRFVTVFKIFILIILLFAIAYFALYI